MINHKNASPKMTRQQAIKFWDALSSEEKAKFNVLMKELQNGKLLLDKVLIDDNEQIQRVILSPKDKAGKPTAPFAKHFKLDSSK